MNINVNNLQNVIRKATLNYVIPSVHLNISTDQVISKMRSQTRTVVISLKLPNDVITDLPDMVDFNFDEPNINVKPYLNLIDSDTCQLTVTEAGIKLKEGRHKTDLFFCMPSTVTTFTGNEPDTPSFFELSLTDEVKQQFDKIRKIAGKFEVVYFSIKEKKFIIEATDRTNRYTNGISFELANVDYQNVDICLDFKNFNALLQVIDEDFTDFTAKFTWMESQEAGMVTFEKNDGSEKYYIIHHLDE